MAIGVWVLNVFAAAWAAVGLVLAGAPRAAAVAPALGSAALGLICVRALPAAPAAGGGAHVGQVVGVWSGVEAVLIFSAVFVLRRLGGTRFIVPVVGLIVGLHFLPLARDIPVPLYYATGSALVVLCAGAMVLPARYAGPVAAFGCAVILWATSLGVAFG